MMILAKILFLIFIKATLQASSPSSPTYEAGVVEFNVGVRSGKTAIQWMNEQLEQYLTIMDNAPTSLDIIVFPESTLNNISAAFEIPEISDNISPCDDNNYDAENPIKRVSCAAKQHQRYVVINLVTKAKCPDPEMIANNDPRDCSLRADGFSYYNTNVVFDRNGTVISRYRKFHLFGESVDKPYKPPMATFETDFGVKFGHFICFDIVFRYPALELVRTGDLTDIVFPTMWFSEFPYSTAVQVHQNWAFANNVNLLAAGANNVPLGSTGTGIYGGKKGAYVSDMAGESKTSLYTSTVYKIKGFPQNDAVNIEHNVVRYTKEEMKVLHMPRDPTKDNHEVTFTDDIDSAHYHEMTSQKDGFSCKIKVNYTVANSDRINHYQYAMAFFHGNRSFFDYSYGGVVVCTLLACPTKNVSSCGTRNEELEHIHIWNSIEIEAEMPTKDGQYFYFPTTLDNTITTLQPELFDYETTDLGNDKIKIVMTLKNHAENIVTFGVYGRDFTLDEGIANKVSIGLMLSLLIVLIRMF